MAKDRRVIDPRGLRLPYSCENRNYKTNIRKGFLHGACTNTKGSVIRRPLFSVLSTGESLWLEHIIDKRWNKKNQYWLMWYDKDGKPKIASSAVFGKKELIEMAKEFINFIP